MKSSEIRSKFLTFYKKHGHTIIPSSSLVPENDPTTLFTGSGMQPLIPYLLGKDHPSGKRLADSQKSFRAQDIEDVGDNRHTTFFEMLGNWSLGDYFKKEQLPWIFEFLTKEVGIDPKKLYVTVFSGDEKNSLPKDTESADLWKKLFKEKGIEAKDIELISEEDATEKGMHDGRIFYYYKKNWWSRSGAPDVMPAGEPGGPCSEMFYEFSEIEHDPKFGKHCHPNCDCGRYLEIGNSVFMEYLKKADGSFDFLPKKNVDFGGGFERIAAVSKNLPDVFKLDIFADIIKSLEQHSNKKYDDPNYTKSFRIILDHVRSAVFLIADGVTPSNNDRGYFVRRLIRRAVRHADMLGVRNGLEQFVESIAHAYKDSYPEIGEKSTFIINEISVEESKFRETLKHGLKEFEKGVDAFTLFSSYGFPLELTLELAKEMGIEVDVKDFDEKFKKHQELSRTGAEKKFKGGLADTSEMSVKYHTATHLLHQALHDVLGEGVMQKGSNITPERLRFDFSHGAKMTDEEKKKVEDIVNEKIKADLPVQNAVMSKAEAEKTGARHFFGEKYGDEVSIYFVGKDLQSAYSKEFCGGPHVTHTGVLGKFKIQKEEAVAQGIRRIKAVLE
jgi:alanyl-tRNA synthetase